MYNKLTRYCCGFFTLCLLFACIMPIYGNSDDHTRSLILKGVDANDDRNYVEALKLFSEAKELAIKNNQPKELFLAINNTGITYSILFDHGEALKHFLEAYSIALNNGFEESEYLVLNNIAILYSKEQELDKSKLYFEKALNMIKKMYQKNKSRDHTLEYGKLCKNTGITCNELGLLDEAEAYFNQALTILKITRNNCWT